MQEKWDNGLCREFVKAIGKTIDQETTRDDYIKRIGIMTLRLYQEMFQNRKM